MRISLELLKDIIDYSNKGKVLEPWMVERLQQVTQGCDSLPPVAMIDKAPKTDEGYMTQQVRVLLNPMPHGAMLYESHADVAPDHCCGYTGAESVADHAEMYRFIRSAASNPAMVACLDKATNEVTKKSPVGTDPKQLFDNSIRLAMKWYVMQTPFDS